MQCNHQFQTVSNRETEVQTEDEQSFLAKQQQLLQQAQARCESPMRTPQAPGKTVPRTSVSSAFQSYSLSLSLSVFPAIRLFKYNLLIQFQMDGKLNPGTPSGEGVLANFFNSLLTKKSGAPSPGGINPGGSPRSNANGLTDSPPHQNVARSDAAAELDRLTRSVKKDIDFSQSDC